MLRQVLLVVIVAAIFPSCEESKSTKSAVDLGSEVATEPQTATTKINKSSVSEMADFQFHTMIANLPSPLETFHLLAELNVDMSDVKLTGVEKSKELNTMSAKAYGYGMYITDMGFLAYENRNQQTLQYFEICRELARSLGTGDVFDRTISSNFEQNTSNEENFVRMMDGALNAVDQYMQDNERFINATEIFVGCWVESQLIATEIVKDQPFSEKNSLIYSGIYEQKTHASRLMNVLSEIETELSEDVVNNVEDLLLFYAGFSEPSSISSDDLAELEQKLLALKASLLA